LRFESAPDRFGLPKIAANIDGRNAAGPRIRGSAFGRGGHAHDETWLQNIIYIFGFRRPLQTSVKKE
jgi:hypothetical protein